MDAAAGEADEAALARRILACAPGRDGAAEAGLCSLLGPRIRLYGRKHLRDDAGAKDLVQDVLILLLEKLREGAVRDPSQVASFALGTARQMVVDRQRGGRRRERILQAFPEPFPFEHLDPAPPDATRLAPCLAALPDRERTVLVLTFYDERPAAEVAAELGVTAGNVRVIRHRGLERLRRCLETTERAT